MTVYRSLPYAVAPHQSDPRSDSSKKIAEDNREKGNKGESSKEEGDKGKTQRVNEREKTVLERTERYRHRHANT